MPSCVEPPLPGVTPPTTFVPYSTICFVWNVPSFPVMPCTTRRVDLSTRTLIGISGQRSSTSDHFEKRARSIARRIDSREFKFFAVLWHFNLPTESIANVAGHRLRGVRLAVRDENAFRRGRHSFQPANHFLPIGVRGKAANLFNLTLHGNPLPEDFDILLAIRNTT